MTERTARERSAWGRAALVASLLAVDPCGCGGAVLRARPGPVRDRWLALLRELSPPATPFRRIPAHVGEDRLLGGLDLAATLRSGARIAQRGLLAESDGGFAVLAMAERTPPGIAAQIAAAREAGEVALARDGITDIASTRFAVLALDEGCEDGERVADSLADGLAFHVMLDGIRSGEAGWRWHTPAEIVAARALLPTVEVDDNVLAALCEVAQSLGIRSHRAALLALRTTRACAALDGRSSANADDAVLAARLVLAPRATEVALPPQTDEGEPEPPEPSSDSPEDASQDKAADTEVQTLEDVVLAAARAAIPDDLLARLRTMAARGPVRAVGRSGEERRSGLRGRPAGVRAGRPGPQGRLSVIDTLRAAAPWQRIRRTASEEASSSLVFRADDFRIRRFRARTETTTIFAVDASGSSALHRLAEAKGAVELLLAECYVRRDRVAVVAFRGRNAELLLPPTRSLARAKRGLAGLPGGGGTPLASGLDIARSLADAVRRRGGTPSVVVLTDGQANVARDGTGGRERALQEALQAARLLRASGTRSIVIDTGQRPHPLARQLANDLGARYVALPQAGARAISEAALSGQSG